MASSWSWWRASEWQWQASPSACQPLVSFSRWWRGTFVACGLILAWQQLLAERRFTAGFNGPSVVDAQMAAHLMPWNHRAQKLPADLIIRFGAKLPRELQIGILEHALRTDPWATDLLATHAGVLHEQGRHRDASIQAAKASRLQPMNKTYRQLAELTEQAAKEHGQ